MGRKGSSRVLRKRRGMIQMVRSREEEMVVVVVSSEGRGKVEMSIALVRRVRVEGEVVVDGHHREDGRRCRYKDR